MVEQPSSVGVGTSVITVIGCDQSRLHLARSYAGSGNEQERI